MQLLVKVWFELRITRFQVWFPNHSAMLHPTIGNNNLWQELLWCWTIDVKNVDTSLWLLCVRNTRIQTCNNILPQGFHTFEVYSILLFDMQYCNQGIKIMGILQLSNHVVQNGHTGEQMTHWDMLKKATKFEFSLFNMSQCVICSLFVPRDRWAANGPFRDRGEEKERRHQNGLNRFMVLKH